MPASGWTCQTCKLRRMAASSPNQPMLLKAPMSAMRRKLTLQTLADEPVRTITTFLGCCGCGPLIHNRSRLTELAGTGQLRRNKKHSNRLPMVSRLPCMICIHKTTGTSQLAFSRFQCARIQGRSKCYLAPQFVLSLSHICMIR